MSGITISSPAPFTTTAVQNVGSTSATGFFFLNGWDSHPEPGLQYVQPGWTVLGNPTWVVTVVGDGIADESITITGGTFLSGVSYQFVSPNLSGVTFKSGITIG